MKRFIAIVLAIVMGSTAMFAAKDASGVSKVKLGGYVGERIDGCLNGRVLTQDTDELVETFTHPRDVHGQWASEFWGKWVQGAIAYYRYTGNETLYAMIRDSAEKMMATQEPSGYIGDYAEPFRASMGWDVWGRKYTLLGLYKWYKLSGDTKALDSACRLLDYTMTQLGPGKKHFYQAGLYMGMPPSSILEPVMFLYNETGKAEYLDFAKFIVADGESEGGARLIAKCDEPVGTRFPLKPGDAWFSPQNGQKGYEMMSCYVGLIELYKTTGEQIYLEAAKTAYKHVRAEEVNIAGGSCSMECFYGGFERQTHPALHTMETCVTFTWMQFAERLLEVTGDSRYADDIERTMYNALMSSMKADNSQIVKYVPLEGYRREGEHQCGVNINCCNANGPRAFAMIPRVAYRMPSDSRIDVNFYIPSEAAFRLGKRTVTISQETAYPQSDEVMVTVNPDKPVNASIAFRIPSWSVSTVVEVNGEAVSTVARGQYCIIEREWKTGDAVRIRFDMPARPVYLNNMVAILRGPVLFSRDSRFGDGFVDEPVSVPGRGDTIEMKPAETLDGMWMAYTVRLVCGPYADAQLDAKEVHLCDFASAGNTWDESQRYRVWLPELYNPGNKDKEVETYW